ncbi:hypothetical protein [Candidatus Palauibacter sp.]|uniref:hypothetical protein n=1 Tax=Candidatus Palauibacter sp. TaxID=3101350 RepID=UPI003B011BEF
MTAVMLACLIWAMRPSEPNDSPLDAPGALVSGTEIAYVFVPSTTCAGINDPNLEDALRATRRYVGEYARGHGYGFATVGVSIDTDLDRGKELLERFGPFDEIHVGRGYLNAAAQRYMRTFVGVEAVPQVVILRREVRVDGGIMRIEHADVLLRKVGAETIGQWVELAGRVKEEGAWIGGSSDEN